MSIMYSPLNNVYTVYTHSPVTTTFTVNGVGILDNNVKIGGVAVDQSSVHLPAIDPKDPRKILRDSVVAAHAALAKRAATLGSAAADALCIIEAAACLKHAQAEMDACVLPTNRCPAVNDCYRIAESAVADAKLVADDYHHVIEALDALQKAINALNEPK